MELKLVLYTAHSSDIQWAQHTALMSRENTALMSRVHMALMSRVHTALMSRVHMALMSSVLYDSDVPYTNGSVIQCTYTRG